MQPWHVRDPQLGKALADHGELRLTPRQFRGRRPGPLVNDPVSLALPGNRDRIRGLITEVTDDHVIVTKTS